jgi:hypothetical protein
MALFAKKKTKTQNLEPELTALQQRARALDEKRQLAEAELGRATESRQHHLIAGALDDTATAERLQGAVNIWASTVVGLEDAIALVQAQIADIERKLDAERTQAERHAAAEKLTRDLDEIERALPLYLDAAQRYADAVETVAHFHFESGQASALVRNVRQQIEVAGAFSSQELRSMIGAVREGAMAIPPKAPAAPEPVAVVERPPTQTVFLLRSVKYKNAAGKTVYASGLEDCEMSVEAAQRALRCGAAVNLSSPKRRELKGAKGGTHGDPNAVDVTDLDTVSDFSAAHFAGPENEILAKAGFYEIDRSADARVIQIAAGRAG